MTGHHRYVFPAVRNIWTACGTGRPGQGLTGERDVPTTQGPAGCETPT